jgi:cell wall-associated NlpC family hydrolase
MKTQQFIDHVRTLIDVKYLHGGRSRDGVDCCGVLTVAMSELGIPFVDRQGYSRKADGQLIEWMKKSGDIVTDRRPGDVAVFWFDKETKLPQHVGLLTDKGMIHAFVHTGKVVEVSWNSFWEKRLLAVFRIPSLEQ